MEAVFYPQSVRTGVSSLSSLHIRQLALTLPACRTGWAGWGPSNASTFICRGKPRSQPGLKKETPYSCSVHHWGEKKKPKKSRHSQWLFGVGVEPGPKNGLAEPNPRLRPPHPRLLAHSFKSPVIKNQRNICSNNQRRSKELIRWAKQ